MVSEGFRCFLWPVCDLSRSDVGDDSFDLVADLVDGVVGLVV